MFDGDVIRNLLKCDVYVSASKGRLLLFKIA